MRKAWKSTSLGPERGPFPFTLWERFVCLTKDERVMKMNRKLEEALNKMDEGTYAEVDLIMRMLEEGQGLGVISRIWYDPYEKVMKAEYVRWERTAECKAYPADDVF